MPAEPAFVIVGASLAGAKAAEALRDEGFDGAVVLIGAEDELPYERPPLSKGYLLGKDTRDSFIVHDEAWYGEHDVDLRRATIVTSLGLTDAAMTRTNAAPSLTAGVGASSTFRTDGSPKASNRTARITWLSC